MAVKPLRGDKNEKGEAAQAQTLQLLRQVAAWAPALRGAGAV